MSGGFVASGSTASARDSVARSHLRGSSLLLSGRTVAVGVKFLTQVLLVRHLATSDYGAWAYALTIVALFGSFSTLSLQRSASRFLAIYHEAGRYDRFFGLIAMIGGTILLTTIVFVTGVYAAPDLLLRLVGRAPQPVAILTILVFMVPLEALDVLVISIFATFNRAKAIFFRRYVLGPFLQLSVVLTLLVMDAGVVFLAFGYVFAQLTGVVIYSGLLAGLFRRERLLEAGRGKRIELPAREVIGFTIPLMTSDWLSSMIAGSGVLLLGYFYDTEHIAVFKAVLPIAVVIQLVMQSFALLYTPMASRLFAAEDYDGINDLYWRTAAWIAVLSFPLFAVCFVASDPLTTLLFGERYATSGPLLAILAVGYYFQSALGFNGATLKVLGRLRYLVVINLLALITNAVLAILLVPPLGALGAALALTGTLIAHNLFKQTGLRMATGIPLMHARYAGCYGTVGVAVLALALVRMSSLRSLFILVPVAALVSLVILMRTRQTLSIGQVFPELRRIPFLRAVLA